MKLRLFLLAATLAMVQICHADILVLVGKEQLQGTLTVIGDKYVEFKHEKSPGLSEWIKVLKKDLLAVVGENGKIIYPRDKFDENALNFGRVKIRNEKEAEIYTQRQIINRRNESISEKKEKNRFKVAALVGGLSGLMVWALLGSR